MTDQAREDLSTRMDELEATLSALRDELEGSRGPLGLPRPPRPRELLRFTDEYAIPAAVAALQANIRALELLQAGIRASDPERAADEAGRAVRDRASAVGGATLDRLDRALTDLESALAGREGATSPEARRLLSEARELNDEIRDRAPTAPGAEADAVRIDVEDELEAIREEVASADDPTESEDGPRSH